MDEPKKKRGRPRKGGARRRQMNLRVTDDFYNEVKELSELEGKTHIEYIIDSVKAYSALTKSRYLSPDNDEN